MLWLSEVMIQNPDLANFEELKDAVKKGAADGELFFRMDVKPPYQDTPADWENRLEAAFTSLQN